MSGLILKKKKKKPLLQPQFEDVAMADLRKSFCCNVAL